jgi:CHAT domain-containing protein
MPDQIVYGDQINQHGPGINIGKIAPGRSEPAASVDRRTILMLSANPRGTAPLRIDEEVRAIRNVLNTTVHRNQIDLQVLQATRIEELQQEMMGRAPAVVHFSGHGSNIGGITLADRHGDPQMVPPHALASLFRIIGASVRCVVLNACLTAGQAAAIGEYVPCVVGMSRKITDTSAIGFAAGLYRALGNAQSVRTAFDLGCLDNALVGRPDDARPVLIDRDGVAARTSLFS